MQPAEAPDQMKRVDGGDVFVGGIGTPDNGRSLTRPAVEIHGMLDTAASVVRAEDLRGARGACCSRAVLRKPVKSHVENGAVNGTRTRTTSHAAKNLGSIDCGYLCSAF
jgi:hypothetical protein